MHINYETYKPNWGEFMKTRKNLLTVLMAAVLSMTIISCGGSEGEGEEVVTGVVTNTSNNTSTSVSEVGSARVATTESQFKSYVQKGQFVATQFGNTF